MKILLVMALACAGWASAAAMLMVADLQRRGIQTSLIWIRIYLPKYIHQYRKLTRQETGHVGKLFYHFVIPINLALLLVLTFAVLSGR